MEVKKSTVKKSTKNKKDENGLNGLEDLFGKLNTNDKKCPMKVTLEDVKTKYESIIHKEHTCIKTKNKGGAGHLLEDLLGIPHSSDCLDMVDGELKAFPIKENGKAKESVAITMTDKEALKITPFEESRVYKKLENTLFIPYHRKGDIVCFGKIIHFTKSNEHFEQLKKDYNEIQSNRLSSKLGKYLQTRTKGAGHGSTSRAFYLRALFMNILLS